MCAIIYIYTATEVLGEFVYRLTKNMAAINVGIYFFSFIYDKVIPF